MYVLLIVILYQQPLVTFYSNTKSSDFITLEWMENGIQMIYSTMQIQYTLNAFCRLRLEHHFYYWHVLKFLTMYFKIYNAWIKHLSDKKDISNNATRLLTSLDW